MITLFIISLLIFCAYVTVLVYKFGVPASISESSYLYGKNGNLIFWCCMTAFIFPMLMFWLEITKNESIQFLVFLSCAALCFTAITGRYRGDNGKTESNIHTYGTIVCAICSQLWTWFTFSYSWILSCIILILALFIGVAVKGAKREIWKDATGKTVFGTVRKHYNSVVFFVEMALFIMAYFSILYKYIKL